LATEEGIVIKLGATTAWVKTQKSGACESCSAKSSCHTLGGGKDMEVEALNSAGAEIGDRVVIRFKTTALIKVSFLLYIFPILCLIAGAVLGQKIAPDIQWDASASSAIMGFLFFFLAFLFIRVKGNAMAQKSQYRPKVVKIIQKNYSAKG
jgi:sigma-E factor negative regulatory protein RseC